ncbi:MAG: hypothetical protein C4297_11675 [Gemmataceae bacterium]
MLSRRRWLYAALLVLPVVAIGSLIAATTLSRSYVCPLTGEVLPCEKCCPLNSAQAKQSEETYPCPLCGEELPCDTCCPHEQGQHDGTCGASADKKATTEAPDCCKAGRKPRGCCK